MCKKFLFFTAALALLAGCSESNPAPQLSASSLAIIKGTTDSNPAHQAVVAIAANDENNKLKDICTGTLIAEDAVLTAAHCIANLSEEQKNSLKIGLGDSISNALKTPIEVSEIKLHENFKTLENSAYANDIALLKLATPVSPDKAQPILPLPPEYSVSRSELTENTINTEFSGFGSTEVSTSGKKLKVIIPLKDACSLLHSPADPETGCNFGKYNVEAGGWWGSETQEITANVPLGTLFHEMTNGGPCGSDFGGPAFITRNDKEFIAGIASFSSDKNCSAYTVSTSVADHYDWLKTQLPSLLESLTYENCTNDLDDDGNELKDCEDPNCAFHITCKPKPAEICDNELDDDEDGKTDCDDEDCTGNELCPTPSVEICDNELDDDEDGKTDCDDEDCTGNELCPAPTAEICDNELDDDGDSYIDCNDADCNEAPACVITQTEICGDEIDNDGDGKADCADDDCAEDDSCKVQLVELCDNQADDDGDGQIDCFDEDCSDDPICSAPPVPENCSNETDDDADGQIDCQDPDCYKEISCEPEPTAEICDDQIDNNGNGLTDCADAACANFLACKRENCSNNFDDNGNGFIDCNDPTCTGSFLCNEEICDDQFDNNGNGKADCSDSACVNHSVCRSQDGDILREICDNQIDDNQNGKIDCNDPACEFNDYCWTPDVSTPQPTNPSTTPDDSCSSTPLKTSNPSLLLFLLLSTLCIAVRKLRPNTVNKN